MNQNDLLDVVECVPGFYNIPGYKNYAISKEGQVLNLKSGKILKALTDTNGYMRVNIPINESADILKFKSCSVHRLVAKTFLYVGDEYNTPEGISFLQVNHKDRNTKNNHLSNLEWTTPKENVNHAFCGEKINPYIPVQDKDIQTGKITTYPNRMECARAHGFSRDQMAYRLTFNQDKVFPELYQYRTGNFTREWPTPTLDIAQLEAENYGTNKPVLVKEWLKQGQVTEFPKISDLAEYLKVAPSTLTQWLNDKSQPLCIGMVQVKYKADSTPWRPIENLDEEYAKSNKNIRVVQVINRKTGKKEIYHSAKECADKHNLLPTTLNWRLKSQGTKVYSDDCSYGYFPFD